MWNQVVLCFIQMMCYNVYIPLLTRQANDVEENPDPTTFDIIHPMRTVSADYMYMYSQGNEVADHLSHGSVHRRVSYNFSHVTCLRHGKFSSSALFKYFLGGFLNIEKGFLVF